MNHEIRPDITAEIQRIAAERTARKLNEQQLRKALRAARDVGLRRRHAEKLERNRRQKEQGT